MANPSWPGNIRHAMTQDEHEMWNNEHYPGTRQLCDKCEEPTGRCEEDAIITGEGNVLCEGCWDDLASNLTGE